MRRMGGLFFVLFLVTLPGLVQATPGIMKLFQEAYPGAAKTQLADCRVCHMPAVEDFLNSYGLALRGLIDFQAIEARDSDQDGISNIDEIRAGSLPGSQAEPDEVFVFTNRMGAITFNHEKHSLARAYTSRGKCIKCHAEDKFPRQFTDTGNTWQKIAHRVCKGCHKDSGKENAPTKCRQCHVKKQ